MEPGPWFWGRGQMGLAKERTKEKTGKTDLGSGIHGVGIKGQKDKTDTGVGPLLPPDEIGASERDLMKHVSSTENKY